MPVRKRRKPFVPRDVRLTPRVTKLSAQARKLAALHRQRHDKKVVPYSDVTGLLDPHQVYEVRARKLAIDAKPGLEKFAYNLFGPSIMASLALALNPYSKVSFPTVAITPANRTTKLNCIPLIPRSHRSYVQRTTNFNLPDASTLDSFDRTPMFQTKVTDSYTDAFSAEQPPVMGLRSDTTKRTRPLGSDFGTFELRAPSFKAPPRQSNWWSHINSRFDLFGGPPYEQVLDTHAHQVNYDVGPGFAVPESTVNSVISDEVTFCSSLMSRKGLGMIRLALPEHKRYDIGYNLAELKDLPMMIRHTIENAKHLTDLLSFKGAGDAFLNQKFGWDSYVQSIYSMLRLPEKISKRINYLISRRGLPTRFTSTERGIEPYSMPPFTDPVWSPGVGESFVSGGWLGHRDWTLRCVLNLTTKFPDIEIPKLREDLILKVFGVVPTPSTIYNLVPWTWLLEYFVGLGEYIDLIETIHSDHSVFNYGFLTYSSFVKNLYNLETSVTDTTSWAQFPSFGSTESVNRKTVYCAELGLKYQKRIDISTLSDVKSFSRPTTLSTDQFAILGALLTKFVHN